MIDRRKVVFSLVFTLFIIYLMFCLPTYVSSKYLSYPYVSFPLLWENLFVFLFRTENFGKFPNIAKKFSYYVIHRIPVWSMPIAIIVNGINMLFGFKLFKKKWWYYMILLTSILVTIILIDCCILESSLE